MDTPAGAHPARLLPSRRYGWLVVGGGGGSWVEGEAAEEQAARDRGTGHNRIVCMGLGVSPDWSGWQ